jgi:serine/threonine protein kinase
MAEVVKVDTFEIINDRYRIVKTIGQGVFSTVKLALDLKSTQEENQKVAIKIRKDTNNLKEMSHFNDEMVILQSLHH